MRYRAILALLFFFFFLFFLFVFCLKKRPLYRWVTKHLCKSCLPSPGSVSIPSKFLSVQDIQGRISLFLPRGGSKMISEGVQFDQITVLTLRIRKDWPEQTVKTQIRCHKRWHLIRVYCLPHIQHFIRIHN